MNSTRGINATNIVTLLVGFQEKIDHDPYSDSAYQISRTIMHTISNKKIKAFTTENKETLT